MTRTPRPEVLYPDWPAPATVKSAATGRRGGVSAAPFDTLNLGAHVGDDPAAVLRNRALLRRYLELPGEPAWLRQVHGRIVARLDQACGATEADAATAHRPGHVCVVQTADCLPVLLCDSEGTAVAALHGGWRGLAAGVVEATVQSMPGAPEDLLAWLGPAIGAEAYEVGAVVREGFVRRDEATEAAFVPSRSGRWLADLAGLARWRLQALGVTRIYGGRWCTYSDATRFYSHRRDGCCGRMASLIWLCDQP